MKVAVVGQGGLTERDFNDIKRKIAPLLRDEDVEEIYIGFTEETTPCAKFILESLRAMRQGTTPLLTAVVPHRVTELSADVRRTIELADGALELALGEGRLGYNRFVSAFPALVRECGQVLVFWSGRHTQEPWDIIRYLRVYEICYEHVDVEGTNELPRTSEPRPTGTRKKGAT